jgi:antitoxin HicB
MRHIYPCDIVRDEEEERATGREAYVVTFPDVPEAITGGWSWEEAVEMAKDGLGVALGMYVKAREDIPIPGPVADGQVLIPVPFIVAAKLTLYTAMREQGITNVALAAHLGMQEGAVRRLVNPMHRSHISQVEKALQAVGRSLVVEDMAAVRHAQTTAAALTPV